MEMTKDISIGQDKWIEWIEFDSSNANPFDIDKMLEPITGFLKLLEIECVAECCGIDAFSFWSEDIQVAHKKYFEKDELLIELENIRDQIADLSSDVLISTLLNQMINKEVFLELIKHIIEELNTAHNLMNRREL